MKTPTPSTPTSPADTLKLVALDQEDLAVVSAHLQDAVVKIADIAWLPREKRFALVCNRFDWEGAATGHRRRRRTGLHFERVLRVRQTRVRAGAEDAVLNLLAVTFEATDEPSGAVTLVFSGGGAIRLDVECLECQMSDLGPVWETAAAPTHETES